jgi:predicted protein tyrosine phosphatase
VIQAHRHLLLNMNDITFKGTGNLVAPDETHVRGIIDFAGSWDQTAPLLIHCWMGVSRSPAAALMAALSLVPDQTSARLPTACASPRHSRRPTCGSSRSAMKFSAAKDG